MGTVDVKETFQEFADQIAKGGGICALKIVFTKTSDVVPHDISIEKRKSGAWINDLKV